MKEKFLTLTFCLLLQQLAFTQPPKVHMLNAAQLAETKATASKDLLKRLEKNAGKFISMKPVSVMEKTIVPVSGDKHDYLSQAAYFWYDSTKPNGLPYMRRDGVRNPEINNISDKQNLNKLENAVYNLSLAYYLTGKETYAAKATELLRHWFISKDTKMNPNLNFGQFVPGESNGRNFGIIETRALINIADAIGMLAGSASWTGADDKEIKSWYKQFLNWLLTDKMALKEQAAPNNHGTFYEVQVADFALFTGQPQLGVDAIERAKKRMDIQIDAEGKQPLELERTTALGYSTFNLEAYFQLATLAKHVGIDLWNYKNKNGKSIRDALDWLAPYALGEKEWKYKQINEYKKDKIHHLFTKAASVYNDKKYAAFAEKLNYTGRNEIISW